MRWLLSGLTVGHDCVTVIRYHHPAERDRDAAIAFGLQQSQIPPSPSSKLNEASQGGVFFLHAGCQNAPQRR